jgi:hypothetical protein
MRAARAEALLRAGERAADPGVQASLAPPRRGRSPLAATGLRGLLLGAGLTNRLAHNSKRGHTLAPSMCLLGVALIGLSFSCHLGYLSVRL